MKETITLGFSLLTSLTKLLTGHLLLSEKKRIIQQKQYHSFKTSCFPSFSILKIDLHASLDRVNYLNLLIIATEKILPCLPLFLYIRLSEAFWLSSWWFFSRQWYYTHRVYNYNFWWQQSHLELDLPGSFSLVVQSVTLRQEIHVIQNNVWLYR